MKGKEKLIGVVLGVILSVAGSFFGLQVEAVKEGVCGAAPAAAAAPAVK
jgi:hypothetical protein